MKMEDYLRAHHREAMPAWFATAAPEPSEVREFCRTFLSSRLVYYPGSGSDGDPIAVFNRAGAAHCFVYVDYLMTRETLEGELTAGFRGYEIVLRIELTEADLVQHWVRHVSPDEGCPPFKPVPPYGFIAVFQRNADFDDTHGAERFAVLFLAADGYAAFDALFCQDSGVPPPFCIVLQDHGFGGGYDSFGAGGLLEKLASDARLRPRLLLVGQGTEPWEGHQRCNAEPVNMGEHRQPRALYVWSGAAATIPRG